MVRARSGVPLKRGRKRTRKLTQGFRQSRHRLYRQSIVTLIRARRYAFRDRRVKKREFRRLWIARINAACRMRGVRYSELICGLQRAKVNLNRKTLADLAVNEPDTFTKIVELACSHLRASRGAIDEKDVDEWEEDSFRSSPERLLDMLHREPYRQQLKDLIAVLTERSDESSSPLLPDLTDRLI